MPESLLAEAGDPVVAPDERTVVRHDPLPARLLPGKQVCSR
jgi:hypothetical protein